LLDVLKSDGAARAQVRKKKDIRPKQTIHKYQLGSDGRFRKGKGGGTNNRTSKTKGFGPIYEGSIRAPQYWTSFKKRHVLSAEAGEKKGCSQFGGNDVYGKENVNKPRRGSKQLANLRAGRNFLYKRGQQLKKKIARTSIQIEEKEKDNKKGGGGGKDKNGLGKGWKQVYLLEPETGGVGKKREKSPDRTVSLKNPVGGLPNAQKKEGGVGKVHDSCRGDAGSASTA